MEDNKLTSMSQEEKRNKLKAESESKRTDTRETNSILLERMYSDAKTDREIKESGLDSFEFFKRKHENK